MFDVFREGGHDVPALYRTLGNSPAMLRAWTGLAWPLRNDATTSRGLRELIIMRVAQLTGAAYEWLAHHDVAVRHGITTDQLTELAQWQRSGCFSDEERDVLAMTDEITDKLEVSDATWAVASARFSPGELVELTLTAAYYCCVSRVLRTLRMPVDDGDARLASFGR
ncbi:MAG: carboxymuconolactone decarboxylase family protein [Acidimicrobiia bacterium]|nr:carboxymuconolactone decarboxylase family protein [Acidimicrobiia bacterium]